MVSNHLSPNISQTRNGSSSSSVGGGLLVAPRKGDAGVKVSGRGRYKTWTAQAMLEASCFGYFLIEVSLPYCFGLISCSTVLKTR